MSSFSVRFERVDGSTLTVTLSPTETKLVAKNERLATLPHALFNQRTLKTLWVRFSWPLLVAVAVVVHVVSWCC